MDQAWTQVGDDRFDSRVAQATRALHSAEAIELTQTLLDHAARRSRSFRIEIYRRASERIRITSISSTRNAEVEVGTEEGLALRLVAADGRRGFAACVGGSVPAVDWALATAERTLADSAIPGAEWAEGARLSDRDEAAHPPVAERLVEWLAAHPTYTWVESAVTVETWAASGGLVAERSRSRAWGAMAGCRESADGEYLPTTIVAARALEDLGGYNQPEHMPDAPLDRARLERAPIIFMAEPAAHLAVALARILHQDPRMRGAQVGEGWKLEDDPLVSDSILGGTFDDAGFPTSRTMLADGRVVVGTVGSAGFLRRGSYRDRPIPLATSLVLAPLPVETPSKAFWVDQLRIHLLDEKAWVLEVREAHPAARTAEPVFLRVDPAKLAQRCVGGVGDARPSWKGVVTPALVFDGLRLAD